MSKSYFCACLRIASFNSYGELVTPNITRANRFLAILGCSLNTLSKHKKRKKSLSFSFMAIRRKGFSMSATCVILKVRQRKEYHISGVWFEGLCEDIHPNLVLFPLKTRRKQS